MIDSLPHAPLRRDDGRREVSYAGVAEGEIALHVVDDGAHAFLDGKRRGVDHELGGLGLLIGRGDAGELLDLAGPRLLVETLGVAGFAGRDIGLHIDLMEGVLAAARARSRSAR